MAITYPPRLQELDWNLLKIFHGIVEAGGISPAAPRLNLKQPAISLALKRLEDRVGSKLCRRGPAGFELTDEGQRVAEVCEEVNRLVRRMPNLVADVSKELRGRVRLQLISSIVNSSLDQSIRQFHELHPNVELVLSIATWDVVARSLLRHEIDIGIAPARMHHAELRYDLLFREIHQPYCGRQHPLCGTKMRDPADLAAWSFILTGADEPDELAQYRQRHGLGRKVAGLSEHLDETKRLAILGIGVCFLPVGFADDDVQAGRLWPLLDDSEEPAMDIFAITNPNTPQHLAGEMFIQTVISHPSFGDREPASNRRSVAS
jgi:DNA-binding transcriptional LysR family regulator